MTELTEKPLILGIDLGTTFSLACLRVKEGQYHFFTPDAGGDQLIPSIFLHLDDGTIGAALRARRRF